MGKEKDACPPCLTLYSTKGIRMKKCIYCRELKDADKFNLEHIIPQFLGGAYAPSEFKSRDVCKDCNSNLGLFVDAGFEKEQIVWSALNWMHIAFFTPENPTIPLICMGSCDLRPPSMNEENEVCESWLGALGEQVYWIRPKDERLYWYMGGNPRTIKSNETRAYFNFSDRTPKFPRLTWFTFRDAFKNRPRVKKILCGNVEGANPSDIGFKTPDELDNERIKFFQNACAKPAVRFCNSSIYLDFDLRFLAKLGIGISYALFGNKALTTTYADELYKALWHKVGEEIPNVAKKLLFSEPANETQSFLTGEKNAVTMLIIKLEESIALNININGLVWIIHIASNENLTQEDFDKIGYGKVIILYKPIKRCVSLDFPDYLAHKNGHSINKEIFEIETMMDKYKDFFQNL